MNGHLAFEPLVPGGSYGITAFFSEGVSGTAELTIEGAGGELVSEAKQEINGPVTWYFKAGEAGEHYLTIGKGNDTQTKKIVVTTELFYEEPLSFYKNSAVEQIKHSLQEKL